MNREKTDDAMMAKATLTATIIRTASADSSATAAGSMATASGRSSFPVTSFLSVETIMMLVGPTMRTAVAATISGCAGEAVTVAVAARVAARERL